MLFGCAAISVVLTLSFWWVKALYWPLMAILSGLFGILAAYEGSKRLLIGQEGIRRLVLGKNNREMSWQEIHQVGVIGVFPLGIEHGKKLQYIYFSKDELDDMELYEMYSLWPPRDRNKLIMEYTPEMLEIAISYWGGRLKYYNIG